MGMFDKIEKKTGLKMNQITKIADSSKNVDFKNEKSVRDFIKKISSSAGKQIPKTTEDMLVNMLMKNSSKLNEATISKMINKK